MREDVHVKQPHAHLKIKTNESKLSVYKNLDKGWHLGCSKIDIIYNCL
jgi:hypothetical protein